MKRMKTVEILANYLPEWPLHYARIVQGDECIFFGVLAVNELAYEAIPGERLAGFMLSEDHGISVTREEWEAERNKPAPTRYDRGSFESVVDPVIKWLNDHANPHATVIVETNGAQLVSGEIGYQTDKFIKD